MNMRHLVMMFLLCLTSLPAYGVTLEEELAYRVRFSRADDVLILLNKGADPNAVNDVGLPMVSVATSRTDDDAIPVLRTLMQKGADLNRGGQNNQYPVVIAARENNTKIMEFLIKEGKVDYGVKDLNGLLPLEIAEYYGNKESAELIRGLTEEKLAKERERRSPERRDKLVKDLAFKVCEEEYMHYYYISKQDKHSSEEISAQINQRRRNVKDAMDELYTTFAVPPQIALSMKEMMEPEVVKQLDKMVSNRQRRAKGIGGQADLKARCGSLADAWYAQYQLRDAEARAKEEKKKMSRPKAFYN
jgi:ankyrin repeat protein